MFVNYLENFSERYFGIVSRKSESDDSTYLVGTIVKVVDQDNFINDFFLRNYIEFVGEGVNRFKILKVRTSTPPVATCQVVIYDEDNGKYFVIRTFSK
jgi:Lon protease-like protein